MRSNYKKLGSFIQQVSIKNSDLKIDNLLGVSITKKFIPSIANTIGTDMSKYKVVKKNQFTYGSITSRNGDKISVALLEDEEAIVSTSYTVFEVIDKDELLPEYLMMWFRRAEFDRYARYMSHGSTREAFGWDEMCDVELPVPSIAKQISIVKEYRTITDRIKLNEQLNQKLEDTAQSIYKEWFVNFEFPDENGNPYKFSGGKMVYCDELNKKIPISWTVQELVNLSTIKSGKRLPKGKTLVDNKTNHPYIKIANLGSYKFVFLNENFEYLNQDVQKEISRYTVSTNDLVISIVGTIGVVRIIDSSLNGANLTENCTKIVDLEKISVDYLYYYLNSTNGRKEIENRTVGGVQGKLPIYNIESLKIICPKKNIMQEFNKLIKSINNNQKSYLLESINLHQIREILLSKMATIEG